ncbi:hypothetical protein HF086_009476 [Spodoptera exigua]|uniref:2-oxoisovalerate dehydrogenase subunit alpha n=1 Tax=Spodoptera exigua TaxID=7107 RepID=A0A922MFJ5_SPOEX|nr:hypothetical protein HF086_009476 [Spodoptera exigua]
MALKTGASVLRLNTLRNAAVRLLSTHTRPEVAQNTKHAEFPGAKAPYVTEMKFLNESSYDPIPIYRVLDNSGSVLESREEPNIDKDELVNMYKTMVQLTQMDKILYESQRQGRISFYMTNYGEEGIHVGSAAALSPRDLVFTQYREVGVFLYRGVTVTELINQCYGNHEDPGKGRQMPVHYGNKHFNLVTISSPLGTQMPQAVGAAYALKRQPNNDRCVVCYFGDGAARNNGYAISTPTNEQYRGDGIASRGPALGIRTVRVDGTDTLAVYNAVKQVGHHSTSDDSTAYRSIEEIQKWTKDESPLHKFKMYLEAKGLWDAEAEKTCLKESRDTVVRTMQEAEKKKRPHWKEMLEDVYYDMPPRIQKQMKQMEEHLKKYPDKYPLDQYQD